MDPIGNRHELRLEVPGEAGRLQSGSWLDKHC
jgi:hypothetical protein